MKLSKLLLQNTFSKIAGAIQFIYTFQFFKIYIHRLQQNISKYRIDVKMRKGRKKFGERKKFGKGLKAEGEKKKRKKKKIWNGLSIVMPNF